MSSRVRFLYLCVLGAAIAAPFLIHPHWAFLKRPIACSDTTHKKKTPQVRDIFESSNSGGKAGVFLEEKPPIVGFLYLCVFGAAITAPFPILPHWAFFKRPIATYFPLLSVQAAALRFNAKSNLLKRFEPPLGLVPFGGECALILPLKVGAEENKGANCSRPTFAVLFSGATTLQCKSNRNRPQN